MGHDMTITPDEGKYVYVKEKKAPLVHEEHKTIEVPSGLYRVDIVREYDYEKREMTRVVD